MTNWVFSKRPRIGRILAGVAAAIALILAWSGELGAQNSGNPPIRIPPAKLLPPASAAAAPGNPAPSAAAPAPASPAPAGPEHQAAADTPAAAKIPLAARSLLPTRIQVLRDSQGSGLAVYGTLTGAASSAAGVVLSVFANSQAFDPTPAVQLMTTDADDRHAQALFTATVRGAPVTGIAVTSLSETGGDVTVFYDATPAFPTSLPRMREALGQSDGVGLAELAAVRLGDGNTISLPPGWQSVAQGVGSATLRGPQGEWLSLAAAMPVVGNAATGPHLLHAACCDPVDAFAALLPQIAAAGPRLEFAPIIPGEIVEAEPAAAAAGGAKGAFILASVRLAGDDAYYLAYAEAMPGFTDPWTFRLSGIMAPRAIFAAELPTMLRMWKSYGGARPADGAWSALSRMSTTQQMLDATITARATGDYNAAPGWDAVVVAFAKSGSIDTRVPRELAERLTSDTHRPWHIVPPTDWK